MSAAPTGSSTNVLVVEDEMVLRMRAVDIVEDAGFTAVEAVNADDALSILESRSDIALLFSDIQMPGSMDGLKLAHAVHDRWPSIKIILVSGQVKLSDDERPADSRFFGKPLEVKQMVAELQEMVGAGALKIVPEAAIPLAIEARARTKPAGRLLRSDAQEVLTAENDSLRLLLGTGRHRRSGPARAGGHRCQGARSRRQAAEAHSRRIAPSHQEYARDRERHRVPEPANGDQH
jgi:CheY-like chemotaxis protein